MKTQLAAIALTALAVVNSAYADGNKQLVSASEVKWEQLNPARGDKSPQAGTLWGDRKGTVATGFLVKFVDGFSSPPHIHNVSYRGVVISGLIHNDDPDAAKMWMPAGSFWTQPQGEIHITAAKGATNVAFIEIEQGPYLVTPVAEAFDNGERPVNVDAANLVWLDAANSKQLTQATDAQLAFLWGKPQSEQLYGALLKLPTGFSGEIRSQGTEFRAVVIQGAMQYQTDATATKNLAAGSYFSSNGAAVHPFSSATTQESIIYVRTNAPFDVLAAK